MRDKNNQMKTILFVCGAKKYLQPVIEDLKNEEKVELVCTQNQLGFKIYKTKH